MQASEKFEQLVESLSDEQFNWRPTKKEWSIAECIDHLNVTATLYFPLMKTAIEEGKVNKNFSTGCADKGTIFGGFLLWGLKTKLRIKLKAPSKFVPNQGSYSLGKTADEFRKVQRDFVEILTRSDGLGIGKIRHSTPVFAMAKVTLDQAFDILSTHEHRHLNQAQGVRRSLR